CRVGRADLRKWSPRLERAIPQVLEAVPNLRFVFQTAPANRVARLRRRLGDRVLCLPLTGDMSELARLYNASDLMIQSSGIGEWFGCSMGEGMFWRLPVIGDAPPHADNAQVELVDHEATGLVVRGIAGFVDAARRLAAAPDARRRLGEAGREKALR